MPFIDRSYFEDPILLQVAGREDAINQKIATHETDYLIAVLGPSLYDAFAAGIAAPAGVYLSNQFSDQFFKGSIADRWKWIRDGYTFSYGGYKHIWPGLSNTRKRSPLANYIYCMCKESEASITTSTGEETTEGPNRKKVQIDRKYVSAWNQMVAWNRTLGLMITGLYNGSDLLYPEFSRYEMAADLSIDVYNPLNTVF